MFFFVFSFPSMLSPRTERPCGVVSGVVARCCPDKHLSSKLSRLRRGDKSGDKFVSICRKNCLHYCLHGAATFVQAGPIVSDVVSVHVADMTRKCGRQKKDTKKIIVPPTRGRGIKRKITPQGETVLGSHEPLTGMMPSKDLSRLLERGLGSLSMVTQMAF